jgi:hypothetical protein
MNGKSKGSQFERDISKKLSLWFSNNKRDDLFWRSQNSGGRWTTRFQKQKKTIGQSGDIASTTEETFSFIEKFYIECKAYKDINIWSLFKRENKGNIKTWWNKAKKQAKSENKIVWLILKQNNKPIIVVTDFDLSKINNNLDIICKFKHKKDNLNIYLFEELLKSDIEFFKLFLRS